MKDAYQIGQVNLQIDYNQNIESSIVFELSKEFFRRGVQSDLVNPPPLVSMPFLGGLQTAGLGSGTCIS